jgi:hypothetical protein
MTNAVRIIGTLAVGAVLQFSGSAWGQQVPRPKVARGTVTAAFGSLTRIQSALNDGKYSIPLQIRNPTPRIFRSANLAPGHEYRFIALTATTDLGTDELTATDAQLGVDSFTATLPVDATLQGRVLLVRTIATYRLHDANGTAVNGHDLRPESIPLQVMIDAEGPELGKPSVERYPGGGGLVRIALADVDLDPATLKSATYSVRQKVTTTDSSDNAKEVDVPRDGIPDYASATSTILLRFRTLNPGDHLVTITGLTDRLGNAMAAYANKSFTVPAGRQQGRHIAYPRFLPEEGRGSKFNPGDRVDTRVLRLYYFRDARRVAQLINRKVKDLNQVGYDAAQRFAQNARREAEEKIDARRHLESLAVQDAQRTRELQRSIESTRKELETALREQERLLTEKNIIENELKRLEGKTDSQSNRARATFEIKKAANTRASARFESQVAALQHQLDTLPSQIANRQDAEIKSRDRVLEAEAGELRAAQEQFRREVAAGLADRDTYAAGELYSVDPVTQVSISVVGVSRLKLRGPIKGINKIARMIHQIDSPVGQVKIGIHTVQVNGEHGDRMDVVYERINGEIAHSRFLVNLSGLLLRKAVSQIAAAVASAVDDGYIPIGCPPEFATGDDQASRNWRYVYTFFGADFIGELRRMDSELINTENKMLSLHSMDTISLAGALYVAAIADHHVRLMIVERFQQLVSEELPEREAEYVRALHQVHVSHWGKIKELSQRKLMKLDAKSAEKIFFNAHRLYRFPNTITFFNDTMNSRGTLNPVQYATIRMAQTLKAQLVAELEYKNLVLERSLLETAPGEIEEEFQERFEEEKRKLRQKNDARDQAEAQLKRSVNLILELTIKALEEVAANTKIPFKPADRQELRAHAARIRRESRNEALVNFIKQEVLNNINEGPEFSLMVADAIGRRFRLPIHGSFRGFLESQLRDKQDQFIESAKRLEEYEVSKVAYNRALENYKKQEKRFFSKRLLEQFMDEQEEKSVELLEALRSHSSNVDNYLKRLAIAVEDDVNAQFYEPAFQRIRRVSRSWDVTLGQIETTTVLTNNRTLAKVHPAATFEFDLPHRDILLTEALEGSKALAVEYGNLLQDGTFLAGTSMLAGQPAAGIVGDNTPVQGIPGIPDGSNRQFGSELQKLIPDPEIYKFETGTGFEIRPVIQPDGHSIVYTFDYMYTTNVREPVRADEKHLGRVKRHFVHTDVQTSSFELREVSRYMVALKASRTSRGVPLFEDLPVVGALFRPMPSQESSLQTNIILASSVIYPTMFDLMGLRWSPYVDDLGSLSLVEEKQKQQYRRRELRDHLLERTRGEVNKAIGIQNPWRPSIKVVPPGIVP